MAGKGARIDEVRKNNSARAGQVNNSNLMENISLTGEENIPMGIMVALNANGNVQTPKTETAVDTVVGMSIENHEAGSWDENKALDNIGKPVALNVFGGSWVQAEENIIVGASPYIRFKIGSGTVIGAVRADADTNTAKKNNEFTVRRMSADGKAALVIPKSMLI